MSIWLFVAIFAGVMISVIACVGLERTFVAIASSVDARRPRQLLRDKDWNDQNRPKKLNYNYIDWLERELQVGKYDPDRIALGFDDTEQKPEPKPLDPEIDALPMETPGQFSAEESDALVDRLLAELREAKPKPKPVDDSWADVDVRDGVYGPETRGLVRRIIDSRGNWTEIRSFGS